MKHSLTAILTGVKGATFAGLTVTTNVPLAAAHKKAGIVITKTTSMTCSIGAELAEGTSMYANKVNKTAIGLEQPFQFAESNYQAIEGAPACLKALKSDPSKHYVEVFPQSTQSVEYSISGVVNAGPIDKADLQQYLTPSEWAKLNEDKSTVYNHTNAVVHEAVVRTIKLESIDNMRINGWHLAGEFTV